MIDIAASPNPPAIEITSPPKDQTLHPGEPVEITWSASDPDGDELAYSFSLSQDGGQRYGYQHRDLTVSMAGASRQGCQTGVGGSVVTHNPTDLCVLETSCPMLPPPPVRRLGADLIRSLSALVV